MLFNKFIKKLILVSLFVAVPGQTMPWSFLGIRENASQFFSVVKKTIKKYRTPAVIAIGGCIATCAVALGFKNRKTTATVALSGLLATCVSKIYCTRKEAARIAQEDAKLDAALAEENQKIIAQEDAKLAAALAEENQKIIAQEDAKLAAALAEENQKIIAQEDAKLDAALAEENQKIIAQEDAKLNAALVEEARKADQLDRLREEAQEAVALNQQREQREQERQADQEYLAAQRQAEKVQKQQAEEKARSAAENEQLEQEERESKKAFAANLEESFVEIGQRVAEFNCSPLTHGYIKSLYNSELTELAEYITNINKYSPRERQILSEKKPHSAEKEEEIRAFKYIVDGEKYLVSLLNGNIDEVPGYNRVARMSDEECVAFQSNNKVQEKEEIRRQYLHSITSVVWALYNYALKTGDAFTQGAFHMQSEELQKFFLHYIIFVNQNHNQLGLLGGNCNHPHAYQRISSHLKALSKEQEIYQYGVDIRFGENGAACNFLPNNMTHILFIPYAAENHRFILKPEDDCMYNFGEIFWHGIGLVRSKLEGLVGSGDSAIHQRKERVPSNIIAKFDEYISKSNITKAAQEQYKKEVRTLGIQRIVGLENKFEIGSQMDQFIQELKKEKHADMRFGREVIIAEEELIELGLEKPLADSNLQQRDIDNEISEKERIDAEESNASGANQLQQLEEQLEGIERFLAIDPDEIHDSNKDELQKSDFCLDDLEPKFERLYEQFKKCLQKILVDPLKVYNIEQRFVLIVDRIEALREHCFSGINFNSCASADDIEQDYKNNFRRPLENMRQTFQKFMATHGLYGFIDFEEVPLANVSYSVIQDAFKKKQEEVDREAEREGHGDLTPRQELCRQIGYLIRSKFLEENARAAHRSFQFAASRLPDQETRKKRIKTYSDNIALLENCKGKILDIRERFKNAQRQSQN